MDRPAERGLSRRLQFHQGNKKGQVKTYYFESKEDAKHWKMMCEKLRDIFKVEAKYTLRKVKN